MRIFNTRYARAKLRVFAISLIIREYCGEKDSSNLTSKFLYANREFVTHSE